MLGCEYPSIGSGLLQRGFLHAALVLLGHCVLGKLVACMHIGTAAPLLDCPAELQQAR